MDEPLLQKIEHDCYLISKGVRVAGLFQFHKDKNDEIEISKAVKRFGLKYKLKMFHKNDHCELWIYKSSVVQKILKDLPENPSLPIHDYVLGKLFGYSDVEIFKFINKNRKKR